MDRLSQLLRYFSISAGVFYTGNLCGLSEFDADDDEQGHLHLLQSGQLTLVDQDGRLRHFSQPTVLFFPRPASHKLKAHQKDNARLMCASIRYGTGCRNPLANALPSLIAINLSDSMALQTTTSLLFDEASHERQGKAALMDRLAEIFVVQLLRHALQAGLVSGGLLSGMADPRLAAALHAIHTDPSHDWTLPELASMSSMSRSKFAEQFKSVIGLAPGEYLQEWRVAMAQVYLKNGKPVNWVANHVGYENGSTLSRVFRRRTGMSPTQWLQQIARD